MAFQQFRQWDMEMVRKSTTRTTYTPEQLAHLNHVYSSDKYPDTETKARIAEELGKDSTSINIWFCNKRAAEKKQTRDDSTSRDGLEEDQQQDEPGRQSNSKMKRCKVSKQPDDHSLENNNRGESSTSSAKHRSQDGFIVTGDSTVGYGGEGHMSLRNHAEHVEAYSNIGMEPRGIARCSVSGHVGDFGDAWTSQYPIDVMAGNTMPDEDCVDWSLFSGGLMSTLEAFGSPYTQLCTETEADTNMQSSTTAQASYEFQKVGDELGIPSQYQTILTPNEGSNEMNVEEACDNSEVMQFTELMSMKPTYLFSVQERAHTRYGEDCPSLVNLPMRGLSGTHLTNSFFTSHKPSGLVYLDEGHPDKPPCLTYFPSNDKWQFSFKDELYCFGNQDGRAGHNHGEGGHNPRGGSHNHGKGSRNHGGGSHNYGGGSHNYGGSSRNYEEGSRNHGGGSHNYGGGEHNHGGGSHNYGGGDRNYGGGSRNHGGGERNYGGGSRNHGVDVPNYGGGSRNHGIGGHNYGGGSRNHDKGSRSHGKWSHNYEGDDCNYGGGSRNHGGGSRNYGGGEHNHGEGRRNHGRGNHNYGGGEHNHGRGSLNYGGGEHNHGGGSRNHGGGSRNNGGGSHNHGVGAPNNGGGSHNVGGSSHNHGVGGHDLGEGGHNHREGGHDLGEGSRNYEGRL